MGLPIGPPPFSLVIIPMPVTGFWRGDEGQLQRHGGWLANAKFILQLLAFTERWENQVLEKEIMPMKIMSTEYPNLLHLKLFFWY